MISLVKHLRQWTSPAWKQKRS